MTIRGQKGSAALITIGVIIAVVFGLVMVNRWLAREASRIVSEPPPAPAAPKLVSPQKKTTLPKVRRMGEVIRKSRLAPGRNYTLNIFYQGGEEIARNKTTTKGEVYDQTGEIPDGKVKFTNESDGTYGVEFYRNQKLHGPAQLYYADDVLNKDFSYQNGKLMTMKEYYHDGSVRMQEDFSDARENPATKEAGTGKVFFSNGQVKYEWKFTVTDPVGFRKCYDNQGRLVATFYYDEYGQPIDSPAVSSGSAAPASVAQPSVSRAATPQRPEGTYSPPKQIFVPME